MPSEKLDRRLRRLTLLRLFFSFAWFVFCYVVLKNRRECQEKDTRSVLFRFGRVARGNEQFHAHARGSHRSATLESRVGARRRTLADFDAYVMQYGYALSHSIGVTMQTEGMLPLGTGDFWYWPFFTGPEYQKCPRSVQANYFAITCSKTV
jgi:hypothetical protein